MRRDVLIHEGNKGDVTGLVGLCSNGTCRFQILLNNKYEEVLFVEKEEIGFKVTKTPPLVNATQSFHYQWIEEAFYHLQPDIPQLSNEIKKQVMRYFGKK